MALTPAERLRQMLGEVVPPGGTDQESMFSDEEVADFIAQGYGVLELSAKVGWIAKAAQLANLADMSIGQESQKMSKLHDNAMKMVELFKDLANEGTDVSAGRTHIGKVRRVERGYQDGY